MRHTWKILPGLLLASTAASATDVPMHDMFVCASLSSSSRVMGSRQAEMDGIFKRDSAGAFQHVGANLPLLIAIAFDPRDHSRIYASSLNGVLRSNDGGTTWRIVTGWAETESKSIAIDAKEPDTVYAALPDGVVVSHDRGQTWARMETGLPDRGKYTQCVQVDRTRGGRVLVGCEKGIFLTEDGARTWRQVFAAIDTVNDIEQSPQEASRWLAVSQSAGALESRDGGTTWSRVPGVPSEKAVYNIAFDPRQRGRVAISSWTYGVLTSDDDGRTWTDRNAGLPDAHRVWRVAVDPDTSRLYASLFEGALYKSDDFGRTWQVAGLEGSIVRSFTFIPRSR